MGAVAGPCPGGTAARLDGRVRVADGGEERREHRGVGGEALREEVFAHLAEGEGGGAADLGGRVGEAGGERRGELGRLWAERLAAPLHHHRQHRARRAALLRVGAPQGAGGERQARRQHDFTGQVQRQRVHHLRRQARQREPLLGVARDVLLLLLVFALREHRLRAQRTQRP